MADEIKLTDKLEKIAKEIETLSVVEVAELASYLEEKFGVTAMAMAAPAAGAAALGLMEAKKLVESAPQELLKDVKKDAAEEAKKKLEAAGAKVELK